MRRILDSDSDDSIFEIKMNTKPEDKSPGSPDQEIHIFKKKKDEFLVQSLSEIRDALNGSKKDGKKTS
jgi:hypothetical protein